MLSFYEEKDSYYCLLLDSDILENISYLINKELGSRLRKLYVVHKKVILKWQQGCKGPMIFN